MDGPSTGEHPGFWRFFVGRIRPAPLLITILAVLSLFDGDNVSPDTSRIIVGEAILLLAILDVLYLLLLDRLD